MYIYIIIFRPTIDGYSLANCNARIFIEPKIPLIVLTQPVLFIIPKKRR